LEKTNWNAPNKKGKTKMAKIKIKRLTAKNLLPCICGQLPSYANFGDGFSVFCDNEACDRDGEAESGKTLTAAINDWNLSVRQHTTPEPKTPPTPGSALIRSLLDSATRELTELIREAKSVDPLWAPRLRTIKDTLVKAVQALSSVEEPKCLTLNF
jgi:hypothetical protein